MPGEESGFPVARCALCKRDVLTHVCFDHAGEVVRACVHCDVALDPVATRWVAEGDLGPLGYGAAAEVEGSGCGRNGCGTGSCGR